MKKVIFVLSILAACGLIIGCGGGDSNPCVEAANVQMDGWDEACSGKSEECCFCQCWNDGHKMYDATAYATDGTCTCEEAEGNGNGGECTGTALEMAEACLEDKDACKAAAADLVTNDTTGMCTNTPLD